MNPPTLTAPAITGRGRKRLVAEIAQAAKLESDRLKEAVNEKLERLKIDKDASIYSMVLAGDYNNQREIMDTFGLTSRRQIGHAIDRQKNLQGA